MKPATTTKATSKPDAGRRPGGRPDAKATASTTSDPVRRGRPDAKGSSRPARPVLDLGDRIRAALASPPPRVPPWPTHKARASRSARRRRAARRGVR